MDYQTIRKAVEQLPAMDRLRLVQDICGDLYDQESEVDEDLKALLDSRIEEMDNDPDGGFTWEEVRREALEQIKK